MGVFNRLSQNHFKMSKTSSKEIFLLFTFFLQSVASQQLALGAGSGTGSCRAFPFRAAEVDWDVCPPQLPCCNEYGYCRTREEGGLQNFRDFNGASNGIELPDSVLELENALGGEPGPGLGADSDFDKRQLEKVGSGSPGQRVNPFAPAPVPVQAFSNGGGSFAAGKPPAPVPAQDFSNGGGSSAAGKAENSLLGNTTAAAAVSSSSSRDSSRRRRPSGKQASSGSVVGSRRRMAANRRQQSNQGSQGSQRNQGSQRSQGSQSSQRSQGSQISQGSQGSQTPTQRPRSPARTTSSSRPRPSGRRPRPRPVTSGPRPLGQQSKTTTTRQVTGSGKTSVSGKSVGSKISSIRSSSSRSKTASSQTKDVKATDLYPLAAYKNTAGYPMNLNAENCPNYPFCYWNPYAAGAKD